jgi:hypothetical protein
MHVSFEDNEGFLFKRDAILEKPLVNTTPSVQQNSLTDQKQVMSRSLFLEDKYGASVASKILQRKIWKGMSAEMVTDSWGIADKINRLNSDNIPKEEWTYKNTWLYFENNILIGWGPVKK